MAADWASPPRKLTRTPRAKWAGPWAYLFFFFKKLQWTLIQRDQCEREGTLRKENGVARLGGAAPATESRWMWRGDAEGVGVEEGKGIEVLGVESKTLIYTGGRESEAMLTTIYMFYF